MIAAGPSSRTGRDEGVRARGSGRREVVLVGFQDQGNLGMGYLGAVLREHGWSVALLDFRDGPARILEQVRAADPLVVGFSLIFQYFVPGFRTVAKALRRGGVRAHLTVGGHFPSLCPDETLAAMPELDSAVRFEGELTLVDLVGCLARGEDWRDVPGVAYREGGEVREAAPRALIADLDSLPHPLREYEPEHVVGFNAFPLLASRGCARRCSFCSIHTFYRTAKGKVVRTRSPARIVEEMRELHDERRARIFLFQDDDFPLWGRAGRRWVEELVSELHAHELVGRAIWKISCRAEYVEPELFALLRDAGLYLVYMGLESGTEAGLQVLDKRITVEQNRAAVETLKELGLMWEYGFMLFDPSSTFASVRANARFLRGLVADGSAAATFCRMLPYGGTPIRDRLRQEGRLRGTITRPDYDFLDLRLNEYHRLLDRAVAGFIHGDGVSHQINWAWHELEVVDRLAGGLDGVPAYRATLADITNRSNAALFDFVEASSLAFEAGDREVVAAGVPAEIPAGLVDELLRVRNAFVEANADRVLAAVAADRVTGPIVQPQIF